MDKSKGDKRAKSVSSKGIEDEVKKGVGPGRSDFVWVRDDGAVCFGDECAVLKRSNDGVLDLTVKPDRCGQEAGEKIVDHLAKTAGRGVRITIPSVENK